jgi:uncharacterized protein YndB with AHSA1/START domain
MKTLHYSITIQAPRQVVWDTMLQPETYRKWTAGFCEGSRYEGSWEKGATILFLGPNGEGMKAVIAENRPLEHVSIRHLSCFTKEKEEPITEPAFENYTFRDVDGGTELLVDMDSFEEQYEAMFQETWPRSLGLLKTLCEEGQTPPQS